MTCFLPLTISTPEIFIFLDNVSTNIVASLENVYTKLIFSLQLLDFREDLIVKNCKEKINLWDPLICVTKKPWDKEMQRIYFSFPEC